MKYLCVRWVHTDPDYPTLLYSEIDDARWEVRKVELFEDGRIEFASQNETTGNCGLGLIPTPPLEELAMDSEFEPREISEAEFEQVWNARSKENPLM